MVGRCGDGGHCSHCRFPKLTVLLLPIATDTDTHTHTRARIIIIIIIANDNGAFCQLDQTLCLSLPKDAAAPQSHLV